MFYLYWCKSAFTRPIHKYFEETSRYFYVVVVISPMYLLLIPIPLLSMWIYLNSFHLWIALYTYLISNYQSIANDYKKL